MTLRERLPFITVVTLAIALIIGIVELVPRISHNDPILTLTEVETQDGTSILLLVDGDVPYPGQYEMNTESTIRDILDRTGWADTSPTIRFTVDGDAADTCPQRININTADAWLLEALPGIGPTKATAIVQYRNLHGPFAYVEQLSQVEGIGGSTVEDILPFITVTGE